MKKILLSIILIMILLTGCEKKETPQEIEKPKEEPVPEIVYKDENTTPIGIYRLNGNTLTRLDRIDATLNVEEDVGTFQIFPSNEETVYLQEGFATDFYNTWQSYKQDKPLKIGFNIEFKKQDGEVIKYNILDPSHTFDQWEYFMNYLYDDYANRGKGFYSHIENDEYNENTLFTAFKMQSSYQCSEIASKVLLTVFTYDSDDDFRDDSFYRGNSQATLTICINGIECN